jgi:GWxTD domain-containing protein
MGLMRVWSRFSTFFLLVCLGLSFAFAHPEKSDVYKKWVEEDVRWIITDRERSEFLELSTDKQRDRFVEAFWSRRNPTPGTPENEFKEEHYRRLAYSNIHFGGDVPGWRTDQGRVYIVYGPPDEIATPRPTTIQATSDNANPNYPTEIWRYHHLEGSSHDLTAPFLDTCRCGKYRLGIDLFKEHELR